MILYVETNFPMSIATGRDPQANTLMLTRPASVQIAIPSVCYMEALSALSADKKSRRRFHDELILRHSAPRRNITSVYAQSLFLHLGEALEQNESLTKEVQTRLWETLNQLATTARMITLNADVVQESLRTRVIVEPTDNLILTCILNHAQQHPGEVKVLLSGNANEFGKPEVREVLRNAGVENYFSRTQDFLGWLQVQ